MTAILIMRLLVRSEHKLLLEALEEVVDHIAMVIVRVLVVATSVIIGLVLATVVTVIRCM